MTAMQKESSGSWEARTRTWRKQKQKLINMKSTQKSFSGLKHRYFQELKHEITEFVHLRRKTGVLITYETIKYRAQELRRNSLCQKLPPDFEKAAALQQHVI
jgi:hypothetical protein